MSTVSDPAAKEMALLVVIEAPAFSVVPLAMLSAPVPSDDACPTWIAPAFSDVAAVSVFVPFSVSVPAPILARPGLFVDVAMLPFKVRSLPLVSTVYVPAALARVRALLSVTLAAA